MLSDGIAYVIIGFIIFIFIILGAILITPIITVIAGIYLTVKNRKKEQYNTPTDETQERNRKKSKNIGWILIVIGILAFLRAAYTIASIWIYY